MTDVERTSPTITVPDLCLIVLVGPSGAGKSTLAARLFLPSEVVSSDACRLLVSDDENDQGATEDAFDLLHHIVGLRLKAGRLTVVDATNVQRDARASLVALARQHHVLPVAVVLDVPEATCAERNEARPDRDLPARSLRRQHTLMRKSLRHLQREGFRRVITLDDPEAIASATVRREPRWTDRRVERGPFDVIGDVHGCVDELVALLTDLGYSIVADRTTAAHRDGRRAVFVGDLVDRGPDSPGVLRLVMGMVSDGTALCVPGNHENKLLRALRGRNVQRTHGLAETLEQLDGEGDDFRAEVERFIDGLVSHAVLDDGHLVVAHAGLPQHMHNRASGAVRAFALYGDTTGETDEFGLPVRYPWADEYRGRAAVVYGHTPVPEAEWVNGTICIDTGCVFGGHLTALRWPERELVSVPAARTYYEPVKPLRAPAAAVGLDARGPEQLDVTDVLGKRRVDTRLLPRITVEAERSAAALEVMSRFAADPRWLVHLPPTMAPVSTSSRPGLLEHPEDAFAAFRADGVAQVVCEEKHMGSRAVAIVGRTPAAIARRFRIDDPAGGIVVTRTGRPFFADGAWGAEVVARLRTAIDGAGLWDEWATDWAVIDAELLPWSAKAEDLLRTQYAAVGAAAKATTTRAASVLGAAAARGVPVGDLLSAAQERGAAVDGFVSAYRRYCWDVTSVADLRIAPFAVLATEGVVRAATDHVEQMAWAERLADAAPGFVAPTRHRLVDLGDEASETAAASWWEELVDAGGEGMVVKPRSAVVTGSRGLVQLGLKVRGPEYLRIIYGPEYRNGPNLERLRQRGVGRKRSLATREAALGLEALERFVAGEPLHRVHECVFAVLALESEPVDPRL